MLKLRIAFEAILFVVLSLGLMLKMSGISGK
jgi:hypothetical protein